MQFNFLPSDREILKYLGLITQLGLQFVASILIFFLGFLYLDRLLSANNLLLVPGIVIGLFSGFYNSYRLLKKFYTKNQDGD